MRKEQAYIDIEYAASQLTNLPHEAHKMSDREVVQYAVDMGEEILEALKALRNDNE